jgi:predicted AlkP superfamily pyrophosphatase or phosphodiesterase
LGFYRLAMKNVIVLMACMSVVLCLQGQSPLEERPKLVVGIIVDQMRQEYLYRYYDKFGEGGFKRMMSNGFMLQNAHYNYVPTVTAAGHASVYTGTTPSVHGIIGNDWFDKDLKKRVYCVNDNTYKTVGSDTDAGKMSPHRLIATTITDELRLATQKRSKAIGISIKDRGAVLPVGHMGDAYWFDNKTGRFITSTYYKTELPAWVQKFNSLALPDKYITQVWNTLLPIEQYIESGPDLNPYETKLKGATKPVFPYNVSVMHKAYGNYESVVYTPFADELTTEMAKAAIDGENLGKDEWTDFLAISYSTPDKVGHEVGPNSVELQDIFMRLDKCLEDLFKKLDKEVGDKNYLVFLTSDHAIPDVPQYMIDNKVPAGYASANHIKARLMDYMKPYFPGKDLVLDIYNEQVFLNHEVFNEDPRRGGVDYMLATELVTNFLLKEKGVANVYPKSVIRQGNFSEGGYKGMVIRGYHQKRSGDVVFIFEPNWIEYGKPQGTDHGAPYTYDTHVPVLFYGKGIKPGRSVQYHPITDIAATLAVMLKIKFPNGCTGQPIGELFER